MGHTTSLRSTANCAGGSKQWRPRTENEESVEKAEGGTGDDDSFVVAAAVIRRSK